MRVINYPQTARVSQLNETGQCAWRAFAFIADRFDSNHAESSVDNIMNNNGFEHIDFEAILDRFIKDNNLDRDIIMNDNDFQEEIYYVAYIDNISEWIKRNLMIHSGIHWDICHVADEYLSLEDCALEFDNHMFVAQTQVPDLARYEPLWHVDVVENGINYDWIESPIATSYKHVDYLFFPK